MADRAITQRSIITDTSGNFVSITGGSELITNTLAGNRKSLACISGTALAADTYYLLIDLDNSGGEWPHQQNTLIDIDHLTASVNFASGTAECILRLGIITRIDGTNADISYLWNRRVGVQNANDGVVVSDNFQPSSLTFYQDTGSVVGAITSVKESAVAAINTGTTLTSPAGAKTPALGDVILKADYVADTFSFDLTAVYHSE